MMIDTNVILTICAITACIFSIIALLLAVISLIKVIAMEKATHTVQYFDPNQKDVWASSDKEIEDLNKNHSEDMEDISGIMGI